MQGVQCSKEEKGAVKRGWLLYNLASHGWRENAMIWLWEDWGCLVLLGKSKVWWREEVGFNALAGFLSQYFCGPSRLQSWSSPQSERVILRARRGVLYKPFWTRHSLVMKVGISICHLSGSPGNQSPCLSFAECWAMVLPEAKVGLVACHLCNTCESC